MNIQNKKWNHVKKDAKQKYGRPIRAKSRPNFRQHFQAYHLSGVLNILKVVFYNYT